MKMKMNKMAYTKIKAQFKEFKTLFLEKIAFDEILFVNTCFPKEAMMVLTADDTMEKLVPSPANSKSIVKTVSESLYPNITNHIKDSFIYHEKSDNPLTYPIERMVALPCYFQGMSNAFGVILLYRFEEKSQFFQKEEVEALQAWFEMVLNQKKQGFKQLLSNAGLCTDKAKKIDNKENETERANQFFSSVIHDIRTPMNAVMGFLELLQDEVTPKQREYLTAAYKSSEMVVALINDVLDVNKLSMGKVEIDKHFFSLMDSVKNTALLFYHSAVKKEIDFIFYYDPKIPYMIKTDAFRLKQIMNNLLSNAIKFTPKGGMVIMEFLYEEENDILVCKVKDTGIGISLKAQKSIFQPFVQEGSDTSSQYGGTGLGLAISKQLSELLGGGLFLESEKDKGSEFSVAIPCNSIYGTAPSIQQEKGVMPMVYLIEGEKSKQRYIKYFKKYFEQMQLPHEILTAEEAIEDKGKQGIYLAVKLDYSSKTFKKLLDTKHGNLIILDTDFFSGIGEIPEDIVVLEMPIFPTKLFSTILMLHRGEKKEKKSSQKTLKKKRVLIADDNLINLKLTEEVVRKFGFISKTAKDGQEAVELFQNSKEPFDIILIDQNMPILSGTEAIRKIRALPEGDRPHIYGLTGDTDEKSNREMREAGADDILHKPIKIEYIKEIINIF